MSTSAAQIRRINAARIKKMNGLPAGRDEKEPSRNAKLECLLPWEHGVNTTCSFELYEGGKIRPCGKEADAGQFKYKAKHGRYVYIGLCKEHYKWVKEHL